jgi:hypothetical protein
MSERFDPRRHLIRLQGQEYLEVRWRLVWLRQEHPDAQIVTQIIEHNRDEPYAIVRATVTIPGGGTATGTVIQEPTGATRDYIANGETSAIGRALAALGYGTQFAAELDQGVGRRQAGGRRLPPRATLNGMLLALLDERGLGPADVLPVIQRCYAAARTADLTDAEMAELIDWARGQRRLVDQPDGTARLAPVEEQ